MADVVVKQHNASRRPSQAPPPRRSTRDPGRPDRFHLRVPDLREGRADTTVYRDGSADNGRRATDMPC